MRITVVKIGKVAYPELRGLVARYEERLGPFAKMENIELKDEDAAARFLKKSASDAMLVALDEKGKQWTSKDFASRLEKWADDPAVKSLVFLVGGPLGLSPALRSEAKLTWSLSIATLTSDMAWVLVWEQLYRAFQILQGTGYHHE